jgi:DNA-binding GntR family transcriptional regulator
VYYPTITGREGETALPLALDDKVVRSAKIGVGVAGYLREAIISGQLRPGQRLRLQDLADAMNVSMTPVREALLILAKEGIVETEQYRGFHVKGVTMQDILDIYDLHAFIAQLLVERATPCLSREDLAVLADLDRQVRLAVDQGRAYEVEQHNYELHRLINRRAPDSDLLRRFLRETTRYVPRHYYREIPGWLDASSQDHKKILVPLKRGDGRAAAAASANHIRRAGRMLVEHLSDKGVWPDSESSGWGFQESSE